MNAKTPAASTTETPTPARRGRPRRDDIPRTTLSGSVPNTIAEWYEEEHWSRRMSKSDLVALALTRFFEAETAAK
jgi:hypothetical protein